MKFKNMTHINNVPDRFLLEVIGSMETNPSNLSQEQKDCICNGYDNNLEPEEIASMLDKTNMINENEAGR